ncbi:WecB/TagA/CpsF family glycosyltransferase [Arthrobacter oryzae]|uniref:WecB/TagA/CpsF family glycosyltransferase n=1 Tax=Arthrobacter oryzae TaxID=409290 RepID=UPI0027D7B595|nr:WecB/TagA/CpsF family glycosyltransferase [Arthrobacter oryzae]
MNEDRILKLQNVGLDSTPSVDSFSLTRHALGTIEIVATSPREAAIELCTLAVQAIPKHVHLVNAYTVALASQSADYRECLQQPAVNFPDGKPLAWASKIFRQKPVATQVRGPRLFLDTFDVGRSAGVKHFLLGSTEEVLAELRRNLLKKYPGAHIAGAESPPFRPLSAAEYAAQDARIVKSGAHIVWVGLGTPKQDFEARRLVEATGLPAVAVGAAFDFAAGTVREAPTFIQKLGLEWLFRLLSEPRRLWRRYLFGNVTFIKTVIVEHLSRR